MMFATERPLYDRIYPEFPAAEHEKRIAQARKSMGQFGLDAILVSEAKNVEYFTGCMTAIGPTVGIIPVDEEPLLIVPAYLSGTAEKTSWLRNILRYGESHLKKDSMGFAKQVTDALKAMRLQRSTIGLEYAEDQQFSNAGLHFTEYDYIRHDLSDAKFVSGSNVIWSCRRVKSPLEIDRLEKAATIAMKGYNAAREQVKVGMTEIDIARIFRSTFVDEGARLGHNTSDLGYMNIRAGPERYPMADTFNQDRKIKRGEALVMNCGVWFRRYFANFSRYALVGKPSARQMKCHETVMNSIQAFSDNLKPGIEAGKIHEQAIAPLKKSGFGETFDHTGIGVGLYIHEPPYIGKDRRDTIEPGNVFSFQSWIYDIEPKGAGVLGYEHEFVVTKEGCRPIVPFEDELLWIV